MTTIYPYLSFNGNCLKAFEFYRSIFGGEFNYIGRFSEMPADQFKIPDDQKDRIMHVTLPIRDGCILMGSDVIESKEHQYVKGNNFSISLSADSKEDADRLFDGLSEAGEVTFPINETFWGSYYGTFTDKFGIQWMVSFALDE